LSPETPYPPFFSRVAATNLYHHRRDFVVKLRSGDQFIKINLSALSRDSGLMLITPGATGGYRISHVLKP